MPKQKHPILVLDGLKYYRKPSGYYKCGYEYGGAYYHRALWEKHYGPIPEGYHVHHLDHDRENNDISNYALLPASAHMRLHARKRLKEGTLPRLSDEARKKGNAWHGTEEGRRWHSEHAARSAAAMSPVTRTCARCGVEFASRSRSAGPVYCRPYCRHAARLARGVDDETRQCPQCGVEFSVNKYRKKVYCTMACMGLARRKPKEVTDV